MPSNFKDFKPASRPSISDRPSMVRKGQNDLGFTGQDVNGTTHAGNDTTGWNYAPTGKPSPEAPREGSWKGNRSGE